MNCTPIYSVIVSLIFTLPFSIAPADASPPSCTSSHNQNENEREVCILPVGSEIQGIDATHFRVNTTNGLPTLTFRTAPDFEFPTDQGKDRVYDLSHSSNGGSQTAMSITVVNQDDGPTNHLSEVEPLMEDTLHPIKTIRVQDQDQRLESVQLSTTQGTLIFPKNSILVTIAPNIQVTGNETNRVNITQPHSSNRQDNINKILGNGFLYKPNSNFRGTDNLVVLSTSTAGKTDTDRIELRVSAEANATCDWSQSDKERHPGDFWGNWSVGTVASYSIVQYNLADKKASFNAKALGFGLSFRRYATSDLAWFGEHKLKRSKESPPKGNFQWTHLSSRDDSKDYAENTTINDIPTGCRATTPDLLNEGNKIAAPISFAPTIYLSKDEDEDDLGVQVGFNVGFFNDILTLGVGWNLSGENAGEWYILAGPSFGFQF